MTPIEHLLAAANCLYPIAYVDMEPEEWLLAHAHGHALAAAYPRATPVLLDAIRAIDDVRWSAPSRVVENARNARRVLFAAAEELT